MKVRAVDASALTCPSFGLMRRPGIVLALLALAGCSGDPERGAGGATATAGSTTSRVSTAASVSAGSTSGTGGGETLETSFAFVGCNRVDKADVASAGPSTANVAQLSQTFSDVVSLAPSPPLFFFTGDLVLGLDPNVVSLANELEAWAALYENDPSGFAAKVSLVALPGNHEMLAKSKGLEISNGGADSLFTAWLVKHHLDGFAGNGPVNASPNADALVDDQSRLTYSFDRGASHYVVLNTDTWTSIPDASMQHTRIGWVALHWLAADLAQAEANPAIAHVFVFGHKPIASPAGDTSADATIDASLAPDLAALLDASTKVRGYFCAHAHRWDASRLPGSRGVYQVVAGNGGSPPAGSWATPTFGFTEVRVYSTGRVGVVRHDRPVPSPYDAAATVPSTPSAELDISP